MSLSSVAPVPAEPRVLQNCLAPAKLNLFLHITGRRDDGYHALQTVFQLVDWGDRLHFTRRDDGLVTRLMPLPGVDEAFDLTVRAARLLQVHTGCRFGVDIAVDKVLPMGAGLGGGSSDAATTLLALNRLWELNLPRNTLEQLGLQLGADVPFFIFGRNAFAEGVGEQLQAVDTPQTHFLIVTPPVHVSTVEVFTSKDLTRDSKPITITDFLGARKKSRSQLDRVTADPDATDDTGAERDGRLLFGRNDMQTVVAEKYAEVAQVLAWFSTVAPARMSGSGASVFAAFSDKQEALAVQARLPAAWRSQVADSLSEHPLFDMAV